MQCQKLATVSYPYLNTGLLKINFICKDNPDEKLMGRKKPVGGGFEPKNGRTITDTIGSEEKLTDFRTGKGKCNITRYPRTPKEREEHKSTIMCSDFDCPGRVEIEEK
jgi:hypothetical protein